MRYHEFSKLTFRYVLCHLGYRHFSDINLSLTLTSPAGNTRSFKNPAVFYVDFKNNS